MQTVTTLHDLRTALLAYREAGDTVAFVPTMGALHRGHITLVSEAKKMAKRVVASIFVNPTQFAANEDLATYPRPAQADIAKLTAAHCDLLYMPTAEDMYPAGFSTSIDPGPLGARLEGVHRPGHFNGVATVVVKLLLQILPDAALFGEKDYQQLLVIRHVAHDLNLPIHIIGIPTVRDDDGLALSSRNVYLSPPERKQAALLPHILQETAKALGAGNNVSATLNQARAKLAEAGFALDYLEMADAGTLTALTTVTTSARLLVAAKIGGTRLIDNMAI